MPNISFPNASSQKVSGLWSGDQTTADEGSYYVATNPTPGTVIATTTSVVDNGNSGATSGQTRPVAIIYNQWAASDPSAKSIYMKYFNFMNLTQVPTSATGWDLAIYLEPLGNSAYTSGGSTIVPVQANPGVGQNSRAKIYFGAITAAASTSQATLVARRKVQPGIPVATDEWNFTFGDTTQPLGTNLATGTARRQVFALPPIIIPPGYAMKWSMWGTANAAAPSWEFEMGYVERVPGL